MFKFICLSILILLGIYFSCDDDMTFITIILSMGAIADVLLVPLSLLKNLF